MILCLLGTVLFGHVIYMTITVLFGHVIYMTITVLFGHVSYMTWNISNPAMIMIPDYVKEGINL